MDTLFLHIEYLLLRHDCVVVPGFGAFLNVRRNAYYDMEKKCWMPITEEIRFNRAVNHDDALLVTSIARRERIDYASATLRVRNKVKEMHDALETTGEITIGRIGTLVSEKDSITFYPASSPASSAMSLGFYPIASGERNLQEDVSIPAHSPEPTRAFNTRRNYYIPVNKRLAQSAASLLLLIMVAVSIVLPFSRDSRNINEDQASIVPVKIISEAIDATLDNSKCGPNQIISDNTEAEVAPAEENKVSGEAEWQLIVGTFHTQAEADKFIAANADKGYELTILPAKRLKRISAMGAKKKETLIEISNSAEFQKKYPQAWIYRVEKN